MALEASEGKDPKEVNKLKPKLELESNNIDGWGESEDY